MGICYNNMGYIYIQLDRAVDAIKVYRLAANIAEKMLLESFEDKVNNVFIRYNVKPLRGWHKDCDEIKLISSS